MLESVVAYYLNKYLFNYVENLDSNQLKISVWGGDIVLNNLRIRGNALDDLDLPIQLIYGHLGKFVLKIPWKSIYNQPVVAQIEDLFLLISPKQSIPYNEEKEQKMELEKKQNALKAIDEAHLKELEKDDNKADPTYVEKLVARTINNIQVKIANVHIRYEDNSKVENNYAFGISLNNFEIFTTDSNWEKCFVDGVIRHVFKLATLDSLSVYMNCNADTYAIRSGEELKQLFRDNIAKKDKTPSQYSFLLGPISSVAKLLLNSDPNKDDPPFTIPKTDLSLEMEKLNIGITSTQFQIIIGLLDDMNQFQLAVPYRKYRPYNTSYKGNAKIWWKFAIDSVLEEQVRKKNRSWDWDHMRQHRALCKAYAEAHKERSSTKKPSATVEATCLIAEEKLDLFNLILIRKRVQLEVDRLRQGEEQDQNCRKSWFSGWFGGGKKNGSDSTDIEKSIQAAMTPEEKRKLHKAIGYEDNMAPLQLPEEYEAVHMTFTLKALEIGLYDDSDYCKKYGRGSVDWQSLQTLMLVKLNMTTCTIKQRPAASALKVSVGMKELALTGLEQNGIATTIIKSKISEKHNLLDIDFEKNPLDKQCDQRIQVTARPLEVVYDGETVLKLMSVFVPKQKVNLSELEGAATLKISDFKERSATGMQYMIESHAIVELDITFMPNIIILPQGGKYIKGQQSLVVVGLGELKISSAPYRNKSKDVTTMHQGGKDQDEILQTIMEKAYDRYNVSIENIQIMVSRPGEDWDLCMKKLIACDLHLLRPTSVLIDAEVCVVDDDPRLPKTKVNILLPSIKLNLSEDRVLEALRVAMSIPLPKNETKAESTKTNLLKSASQSTIMRSMPQFLNQDERRKTLSATAATSLTPEVVQYTSLEIHFALKEFSIALVRAASDVESPLSDESADFNTPSQHSEESEFLDTKSSISYSNHESQKLLAFQVLELEVFMAQRTFEMVAKAKLGAVSLTSYEVHNKKEEELVVIDTPGFTKDGISLLSIIFTAVDKSTPDFITKYKSVEQLAQINFATLNVILHQENLLHIMEITNQLQRKVEELTVSSKPQELIVEHKDRMASAGAADGFVDRLARIAEETELTLETKVAFTTTHVSAIQTARKSRKPVQQVVESIKLKIEADLDQVGLELTCRKRPIASLKIHHLYAGVVLKSSYTEIKIGLKDILIHDMNSLNIHSNILSIVGKDALKCDVVLYNLDETRNYNSDDMKINVDIGCMKIVFVNWFINSVLGFMNNFQAAQKAIANASAMAADAAKQNAVAVYEKATRMKLNVKIKAPIILVPIDSASLEAVALDLGQLTLSNVFTDISTPGNDKGPAVMDEIKLILKDMRLARVNILQESQYESQNLSTDGNADVVDARFGFKSEVNILDPTSFTLIVKRNLTFSWYKNLPEIDISGRLKCIDVNLFMDDYSLIMSILNRNMKEGLNEFPAVVTESHPKPGDVPKTPLDTPTRRGGDQGAEKLRPKVPHQDKVSEQFKFNIQLDGVVLNLMSGVNEGLARFGLYIISLKGTKLVDETLTTNIVLCNMQLDDTRPHNTSEITKYLCRKDWSALELEKDMRNYESKEGEVDGNLVKDSQYMLDVTAVIKQNDIVANIRISSFDLILCVDFLLKLTEFFKTADVAEPIPTVTNKSVPLTQTTSQYNAQLRAVTSVAVSAKVSETKEEAEEQVNKMSLTLIIDEPDIILVETLNDMNASSIIFNMHAKLMYRSVGEKQLINGNIDGLKMYMCSFMQEKREQTRHYILHPCVINLHGSTPELEGMNISLKTSEIIINISPATLELFTKAMKTISTTETNTTKMLEAKNYSDIWTSKKFKEQDYWFMKAEAAEDALMSMDNQTVDSLASVKTERCVIEIPSIMIVLEAGIGYYTTPLISMDTCLNAIANDWSSNLSVNGSLTLTMNYYNQSLAVWEPVIEENEHTAKDGDRIFAPWELNFSLGIEKTLSEFEENKVDQTTTIKIHSEENLEMTVSKTFLDLIGTLGEAFGQAMDPNGLVKPDVIAPYVIENDTGFDITLNFTAGIFTLHECHVPNANGSSSLNGAIIFKHDIPCSVTIESIKNCTLSPGCKAYLQTKNLATIERPDEEEYNIYVSIGHIQKQLVLPVSKSDKRYFSLFRDINQDPWGIVSEVNSEYGTTTINIHSVVNIQNHFTTPIKIFRMKAKTKQMILVGIAEPGKIYHVPLHAIYSEGKYLHFGIEDYNTSVQGIKWDDCPTDMNYMRHIQCDPIETFEPFFINVSREKTEVYHEHSNKFKLLSAYYTLHLRPPVYLRNALPINITVSVAGCSVRETVSTMAVQTEESFTSTSETDTDNKKQIHQSNHSFVKEDLLDYGEKDIEAGSVLHLPTVKLAGRSKDTKSYLVVRMIQYLERDWSCMTEVCENHPDITNWKFNSYDSDVKLSMDLCVRFEDRKGSLLITLFSPFWLINKTGQMLSYKTDSENVEVLYHPPEYKGPILFSLRDKYLFDKKSCSIRVDNGEWSNKIPLDVAGSMGSVGCKANEKIYQIGVHNHLTQNSLTKQITFIPFYTITNKCSYVIHVQENSRPGDPWIKLLPNGCFPLWPTNDSDHMMVAKVDGQRTVPFKYSEPICNLLQLNNNKNGGINVDVQTTEGGIYITFTEYNPGDAPGLLINHTQTPVFYVEKGVDNKMVLQPQQKVLYTWSNPAGERILAFCENALESDLRRDGIGTINLDRNSKAYWVSFLDGLQRVLLFTECEEIVNISETSTALQSITQSIEVKIHGIGLSLINNETGVDILYLGITSSGVIWEYRKESKKRFKQLSLHDTTLMESLYQEYLIDKGIRGDTDKCYMLEGKHQINFDTLKMVKNNSTRDIQRYFQPGVWVALNSSPFQSQMHAKINRIQLDNQLTDCIFPVVLAPIPPPKTLAKTIHFKPIIEISIVERVVPHSNVKQYKYAKMLMQEFHFKVDLVFLMAIAELFTNTVDDEREAKLFKDDVNSIERPLSDLIQIQSQQQQKNFYDNLHLGPMKVHLSFSMAGVDTSVLPGILSKLVQGVGVTLTDVNDVVIRLAFFEREYRFFTQNQLVSEITSHYTGQALKQIYVLVLGLDVLGNPYGLVVGIKKGVEDLFYEPFQGAIQGPGEFAEGLVLGVKSLVGHTVGGAAGAVSKITGAMGKGLAVLTFDEEYQKKRRQNLNAKPKSFQEGMARSGKGLVMGFVDGVTGCVTKPISGAKEEGVEGFFKGLGKGTIGLVTRPTAGIVDFAHGTFDSVKRATELQDETRRLRPPRYIHEDKILRAYCLDEAKGNQLLKEIDKGKYANTDNFVHCEEIVKKHEYVVVSNYRIIYVSRNDMFGSWSVQWTYLWSEIERVSSTDRGIEILLKKESKKVLGLFNSSEQQHKLIMMPLRKRREKLLEAIQAYRSMP